MSANAWPGVAPSQTGARSRTERGIMRRLPAGDGQDMGRAARFPIPVRGPGGRTLFSSIPAAGGSGRRVVHQRLQLRVQGHALVEYEAAAIVALAADLLEVTEDAALQL